MIILLGDTHGQFMVFDYLRKILGNDPNVTVIQVGDFGVYTGMGKQYFTGWDLWETTPWPVYFIDGNHEQFPILMNAVVEDRKQQALQLLAGNDIVKEPANIINRPIQMKENLYYIPRGTIHTFEGIKFGFMGGGESVDAKWRTLGVDLFHEERVERHQVEELIHNAKENPIDVLITHVPPASVVQAMFPPLNRREWELDESWVDVSTNNIDFLWKSLDKPPMFCGHMHASKLHERCRVLDINESYVLEPERVLTS